MEESTRHEITSSNDVDPHKTSCETFDPKRQVVLPRGFHDPELFQRKVAARRKKAKAARKARKSARR